MSEYTFKEYAPVDGAFILIYCDKRMLAKTWVKEDAEEIIDALKTKQDNVARIEKLKSVLRDTLEQMRQAEKLFRDDVEYNAVLARGDRTLKE